MSYVSGGTTKGLLRLSAPTPAPAVSLAGEGRIYFDGTQFLASQNGAAYAAIVGGGGGGGWTDDGAVVRLTTVGDGVGLGITSIAAASKLEVLGDATRKNVSVLGGPALVGGDVTVLTGLGVGDGSTSGALVIGSGTADFGTTGGNATGQVTIRSGAFTGTTNDQGDGTGGIDILVGNGVSLTGQNASGGSITLVAGSTTDDNSSSGDVSISAGGAAGTNSSGGDVSIGAGGGYTAGSVSINAPSGGPGGDGSIGLNAGGNVGVSAGGFTSTTDAGVSMIAGNGGLDGNFFFESKGTSSDSFTFLRNPGTPTASLVFDDNALTLTGVPFVADNIGNSVTNINVESPSGNFGGDGTRLYITPNLGIILELGNTIKIDPDGTNNWIYGDDATVAATPGEPLTLRGGAGNTTGAGGQLRLRGGAGGATGAGSNVVVTGGAGGATSGAAGGITLVGGTPVDGNGGSVSITGSAGVGTNRDGGNITLTPGAATGSGTPGATFVTGVLNLDAAIYTGGITYSGGSSYLLANRLVDPQSGSLGLTNQTSRTVYTNEGSAANITLTLPAAVAGLSYTFFVRETGGDSLIIQAGTGDTIRIAASVSTAGGTAESNVAGDCLTLVAINSTEWVAVSVIGTWPTT